ncbi:phosphoribosylaminoimidazolesuccinocarboxamide synthase [Clostridium sp. 'deep sea']|uniref:phosphoribosylaminoimidazolesuccinocarboxamide synthase n=1 Tax=Clostridium sp. 'deep sea' TaxID=2779445 RepID=UPI0018964353|nr:phosphoribosylaminoimidazolesuccinocarboxamide synthase [Clostridium sp. 'deep sea']QOR34765.1 phosphoribosylaminoimidazolesuccinocarboxamide synthase [Clostridium sp. 'deep sea']
MNKLEQLYEGKAKKVFKTDSPDVYWIQYKDDATAFNAQKRGTIAGKGVVNNKMSAYWFLLLEEKGIPTHFNELINDSEMLVKAVEIVKTEVIVRNIAAGSMSRRLGITEGTKLSQPVLEFCYKSDELGDPIINRDHIHIMNLATDKEIETISQYALQINEILKAELLKSNITLVDFKLEFGRFNGEIILADEISPDTCRFWDATTQKKLDKDRFRRDLGGVEEAYQEVLARVTGGKN